MTHNMTCLRLCEKSFKVMNMKICLKNYRQIKGENMKKVLIENLKNLKKLEFNIPEQNDVYLVVGSNGAGKTTLFICLERICNSYSFARGFLSTRNTQEVDQYEKATIQYTVDNEVVKFRKKSTKWASVPRNGNEILIKFDFPTVVFIKADSKRIDISQDEIRQGNYQSVDKSIKDTMNKIFETKRFNQLKRLRNGNGRGKQATFFYVIKDGDMYYSEKRFSSGELALLRLVEQLNTVPEGALILLDEAEMALHPRVQKNLLEYLKEKASEKNLMVLIATHSSTMIKATLEKNIILLLEEKGATKAITPCYPARAIGSLDFERNVIFDFIFFVEDDKARILLKKMLERYLKLEPKHSTVMHCIIPVGGYSQTAMLAINTRNQLHSQSKVFALLDGDVFEDGLQNSSFVKVYEDNKAIIKNLGYTPEVWLIEKIEENDCQLNQLFIEKFHSEIIDVIDNNEYKKCNAQNLRQKAKDKVKVAVAVLKKNSGDNEDVLLDQLFALTIDKMGDGKIKSIIAPMINASRV